MRSFIRSPARAGWKAPATSSVVGGRGSCGGGAGGCCLGGGPGWRGSGERVPVAEARRPPPVAARRPADRRSPWTVPHVRRRARPSSPRRPSPPCARARACARLGPEARPAARTAALVAALPGLRALDGDPRDAASSSARRAPASGSRPRRAVWGPALGFRVGAGWCRRVPVPVPRVAGRGVAWRGVVWRPPRPRFVLLSPVAPRSGGGRPGRRRPRLSLSRASPRRARLLPSETRPQIRRGDPLNLSILVSGGKETNQDSLSNGE